jgi:hypothetical protein
MSKSLSRMTALFVGLLFSVGALFGFAGTAFADDDAPAELDPNTASSQQALLKPCPPLVLPTVTVTVFLPDNEPGACENPQAETFETCLALLATYFGQTLTREQAAQCLPAIPEGFDAGTDPIAESGVQTPPNHDEGRIELTDSDACAAPPSGRPGVHAPTIDLFKVKIKFGSGSEVDVEVGPASLRHLGEQLEELKKPSEYQPGKVKQQPIDAAAMARATAAAAAAAAASAEAARQATAAAAAEALRWKPEDIEWVRQHPASEKGDWVEPSGGTATATPVDPLTDQQSVDHLPCEIARVACAAVGQQLAPTLCEHPELQALKDRLCDGTAIYTIDGTACAPEAVSPTDDELAAGVERALLLCLAVAQTVEGENPCDPNGGADRTELVAALTAKETECRSLVYVDPGAGGEDPCAVTLAEPTPGGAPPTPPVPVLETDQTPPPGGRLP